jgi:hypothetical protein
MRPGPEGRFPVQPSTSLPDKERHSADDNKNEEEHEEDAPGKCDAGENGWRFFRDGFNARLSATDAGDSALRSPKQSRKHNNW